MYTAGRQDNQRGKVEVISVGVNKLANWPSNRYPTFRSVTPPCPSLKFTPVRKVAPLSPCRDYTSSS